MQINVKFKGVKPEYMTNGAIGADLISIHNHHVLPGQTVLMDTGTAVKIPEGVGGFLCARSSVAHKRGLILTNGQGIIDQDFIQNMQLSYYNRTSDVVEVTAGERIGQIVFAPVFIANFEEVESFDEDTVRGEGFGDTNK